MNEPLIKGHWQPQFDFLIERFTQSFNEGEDGAALAISIEGELVVDVWAGQYRNRQAEIEVAPWQEDTLVNVFSAGKGLVAIALMKLVENGQLDLDCPISTYWPEFAGQGKELITPRMVLCHRSGLSAFQQQIPDEAIFDWKKISQFVQAETPWWKPDEEQGYSPFIYGWLLGELARRVSGQANFNTYFQEAVAKPLGVECYFGVDTPALSRIADTQPLRKMAGAPSAPAGADAQSLGALMKSNPRGVTNRAFANPLSLMTSTNSLAWRQAAIPAAGAHTNARGIASIYGEVAIDQSRLLTSQTRDLMASQWTFASDNTLGLPLRFGGGVMLSQHDRPDCRYGRGEKSFGHPGAGGSCGFADCDYRLGFGYVTARMGQSILIDPRATNLIDALYHCI